MQDLGENTGNIAVAIGVQKFVMLYMLNRLASTTS